MTNIAYISFVFVACVLCGLLGIAQHFWRAHATMFAEDLGLGETLNTLTRDDYQFEKNVVGAEWDDAGFWSADSVRNLVYYMASGVSVPAILGAMFWGQRVEIVAVTCHGLSALGLNPPLCF